MKVKIAVLAAIAAALLAAASFGGGFFDGHKSAGWTWDSRVTAASIVDGMSDGNG